MAAPAERYHHQHPLPTPPEAQPPSQLQYYQPPEEQQLQQEQHHHYNQQVQQPTQQHQELQYQQSQVQQPFAVQPPPPAATKPSKQRTQSYQSEKTHKSSGSKDLQETHAEKEARRLHTKADPTLAMNEAEPSAVAAMKTESLVAPLRSIQHKDALGNVIAEPDKSNPTRHRWERPLDTIRSFEAAIDGGYARRSIYQPEATSQWNRRNSYHPSSQQPRFPHDSYYGSRPASMMRPESIHYNSRNSYHDGQGYNNGYSNGGYSGGHHGPAHGGRHRTSRMHSEPNIQNYGREQNVYPLPHKDRSYETVTSAAGSGNSDPAGYQTDPTSSDNSSIDRPSPGKRAEPVNDYGIGFNQTQSYQTKSFSVGLPAQVNHPLPPVPPATAQNGHPTTLNKKTSVLRRQPNQQQQPQANTAEKRKSWFSRRFSKN